MKFLSAILLSTLLLHSCGTRGSNEEKLIVGRWGHAEIIDQETHEQTAIPVTFDFSSNGKLTLSSPKEAGSRTASYKVMKDAVRISWDEWKSEDTMAIHMLTENELQMFSDDNKSLLLFKRAK